MNWIPISEQDARRHALFGMGGYLFAFYVLALAGFLVRAVSLPAMITLARQLDPTLSDICMILLACGLGLPLPFLLLSLSWHPAMPLAAILCLWAGVGLDVVFLLLGLMTAAPFVAMAVSAAVAVPFTLYLIRARRVNVTYRNRVRPEDVLAAQEEAQPEEVLTIGFSAPM